MLYFSVRKATKRKVQKMDACAEVYITKDYSVELSEDDIKSIARDVRITLYNKPQRLQLFSLMVCGLCFTWNIKCSHKKPIYGQKIIMPWFSFVKNFFQKIFWRICRQSPKKEKAPLGEPSRIYENCSICWFSILTIICIVSKICRLCVFTVFNFS